MATQDFSHSPEMIKLKEQITAAKDNLVAAREGEDEVRADFWTDRMHELLDIFKASVESA